MDWQGSVTEERPSLEFLRTRTDGGHFHLLFPDTKIHIIREAATEQQEGSGPNLPRATAKSLGPEDVAQAEYVCYTPQKDHNPNGLLVWMQLYRGMGWGSPYADTAPLIHRTVLKPTQKTMLKAFDLSSSSTSLLALILQGWREDLEHTGRVF